MAKAKSKTTKKAASSQRLTRDQESRDHDVIHEEYDDDWEEPELLDTSKIPPRAGYVQRWVRTRIGAEDDVSNVYRKMNQGWRPRSASTVSKDAFAPTVKFKDEGDVIGIEGMILMERPEKLHKAVARGIKEQTRNMQRAVDENMFNANKASAGSGMEIHSPKRTSRSVVGRPVSVADD